MALLAAMRAQASMYRLAPIVDELERLVTDGASNA
jgi:hypothetical protein